MSTNTPYGSPSPPDPISVRVNVAGIIFTGARNDYNPLYDREDEVNIEPPQWQQDPFKREPVSYVRKKKATIKLDITGSYGTPIWVRVTPTAELLKKITTAEGVEKLVPDPGETSIAFDRTSETIHVTNWDDPDYERLIFKTNALPDEVRLNQLKITWKFEYGYTKMGPWFRAGQETTYHEIYITYAPSYRGFLPHKRPWKQVLKTACSYAHGEDSKIEVSKRVTTGIYDSLEFNYDPEESHSDFLNYEIRLWSMLKEGWVDCMDGSNYYTILMRWLGIPAHQIKISPNNSDKFVYKELLPIAKISFTNRPDTDWESKTWNFHQVGILGDAQQGTLGNHIYDPIIMIDKTGTPRVPTNMIRDNYQRAIFKSGQFVWDANALVTKVY